MFRSYVLYRQAKDHLEESGIASVLRERREDCEYSLQLGGSYSRLDDDVPQSIQSTAAELRRRKVLRDHQMIAWRAPIERVYRDPQRNPWVVMDTVDDDQLTLFGEPHGLTVPVEREDYGILEAFIPGVLLSPQEFWDRGPFQNLTAYWGSAALYTRPDDLAFRRGGEYTSERDGRSYITRVTGDMHGDLRIIRRDITEFEAFAPDGSRVPFRPVRQEDERYVAGYHSVEPHLLASLLKHSVDAGLELASREGIEALLEFSQRQPDLMGNFGDAGGYGESTRRYFFEHRHDLPMIQDDAMPEYSPHGISTQYSESYLCASTQDDDLAIGHSGKPPVLTIPSDEITLFARALIEQAARGQGRTSKHQLTEMLRFFISSDYQEMLNNR